MKPVRLFRHINCSSPGYLGEFLETHGVPFEIACIGEGMQVPGSLEDVSGLVFMGGPDDVNSSLDWMRQEAALNEILIIPTDFLTPHRLIFR